MGNFIQEGDGDQEEVAAELQDLQDDRGDEQNADEEETDQQQTYDGEEDDNGGDESSPKANQAKGKKYV